jgi:hypothetical protein
MATDIKEIVLFCIMHFAEWVNEKMGIFIIYY